MACVLAVPDLSPRVVLAAPMVIDDAGTLLASPEAEDGPDRGRAAAARSLARTALHRATLAALEGM
jgi:hypothetical protein